ncbi:HK97 family phage prohead protease [Shewanella sp. SE1]|uniref:HK97 family phage prohead protease n=1 Tax=Shewanella sp. SE1 TaxID=2705014 RepID=UPI00138ED3B2|nr:HK97 family phage prohead protease [Shewanella sp. SE1]NDO73066.1 HK97 family phage prohead protease [Shewanella sp. SE1]
MSTNEQPKLERKYLASEFKMISENADEGYIEGYLATWEMDRGYDIIKRGAFKNTINDFKTNKQRHFPLCIEHESEKVAGYWDINTLVEDEKGLYGRAYFNLETERGKEWYSHVKKMRGYGLSIGYIAIKKSWKTDEIRILEELELFETSLVAVSMGIGTEISEVKSIRDLERGLKNLGFSNSQAKEIVAKYKSKDPDSEAIVDQEVSEQESTEQEQEIKSESTERTEQTPVSEVKEDLTEIKNLLSQLTKAFK